MASRIHSILPRIAFVVGCPLLAGGIAAYYWMARPYVPDQEDVFTAVAGRWAWMNREGGCATDWHRISFSPDHRVMIITNSKPFKMANGTFDSVSVYDILAYDKGWVRGAIRGETRLAPGGRPVVWDLVLRSPDRYAWHRTDWVRGGYTPEIRRCWDRSER